MYLEGYYMLSNLKEIIMKLENQCKDDLTMIEVVLC